MRKHRAAVWITVAGIGGTVFAGEPTSTSSTGANLRQERQNQDGGAPAPASTGSRERPVDGVRDNSFLIEEAYNQELGVVQHMFTAQFGADHRGEANSRTWELSFTQEWPIFSPDHQFALSIPYAFIDEDAEHESGIGDVSLGYRYQLWQDEPGSAAVAPSFVLVLPSGDHDRGFGVGACGYEITLPVSKTLSDRVYVNFNAGFSHFPNADLRLSDGGRSKEFDLLSWSVGGSVIYAVTDKFHLMLEAVWSRGDALEEREWGDGGPLFADRVQIDEVVISPGFRWAMDFPGDLQIVPGLAFPIGLTDDSTDYGVFLYFSVEHPFMGSGS